MVPWSVLAESHPELAQRGACRLFELGGGLALLSTPRAHGGPRVQPVHPVLLDGRLYLLRPPGLGGRGGGRREAFALRASPVAGMGAGDFFLTGEAIPVGRPRGDCELARMLWRSGGPEGAISELRIAWALYSGWDTCGERGLRAVRLQWRAGRAHGRGSSGEQGEARRDGPAAR